jgi:Zn-dependent peptidase ImmA (M78 family)
MAVNPLKLIEQYASNVPVPVFQILADLGLGPQWDLLDGNISGWIERRDDGSYGVTINVAHPSVRQRFTAAHELGHYIYHRDLLGAGTGDTRAYRADQTPFPNAAIRPLHERQANSFAANLLMPYRSIALLRNQGITEVADLARALEVSKDAMRIRLGLPR